MVDNNAFEAMMANFPEEFLAFFGMNADLPMTSILGYFGITMDFMLIPIAVQASHYGFSILSVEEREYTADFLLSKPISRNKIFLYKFTAALIGLTITNLTTWIAALLSLYLFNGGQEVVYQSVFLFLSIIILFQLFFLTVGMAISTFLKKINNVISYSMALGFGLYIISSFGRMLSNRPLQIMGIYEHYNPMDILGDNQLNLGFISVSFSISIIAFFIGYFLYQKRNIASL
jgi:ABC-2 type transport system permease protein